MKQLLLLLLLLGALLLACRDEAAPGDLDPDPAEEIPFGQGIEFSWEGGTYPYQLGEYEVISFWGSRMTLRSPSGQEIYGTYIRTLNARQPDGTHLNKIMFYPTGAKER